MDNKVFNTVIILIVAVLVGLSFVSRQANAPLLNQLSASQAEMSATLNKLAENLINDDSNGMGNTALLAARLNTLEARLNALESKVNAGAVAAAPQPQQVPQQPPQPRHVEKNPLWPETTGKRLAQCRSRCAAYHRPRVCG